jgi:hypothetical protein
MSRSSQRGDVHDSFDQHIDNVTSPEASSQREGVHDDDLVSKRQSQRDGVHDEVAPERPNQRDGAHDDVVAPEPPSQRDGVHDNVSMAVTTRGPSSNETSATETRDSTDKSQSQREDVHDRFSSRLASQRGDVHDQSSSDRGSQRDGVHDSHKVTTLSRENQASVMALTTAVHTTQAETVREDRDSKKTLRDEAFVTTSKAALLRGSRQSIQPVGQCLAMARGREGILERDHRRCRYCGIRNPDLHHIEYRSQGGSDDPHNQIALCRKHHDLVHSNKRLWQPLLRAYIWLLYMEGRQLFLREVQRLFGQTEHGR